MTGPVTQPPGLPPTVPPRRRAKPPERGSIRTHIAGYCAPCDVHWRRPRLHRYPVGAR